jgi:hypothetical protein
MKFTRLIFRILGHCNKCFQGLGKFCKFKEYREIQCGFEKAKAAFNKKKTHMARISMT